ncbi:DNA polymerase III subunit gamma/tau [Candidatus Synechococcus spongiarum LMB bulk10E]|nr:DNA polymerase III subunit gamma/tau [Candidatus Synechococcus spongiarum LMB bulk10E]OOV36322.1 DNA polymerase III subunit gamma/tau [Candidatus Synechococcus spongiarum LMB bulk10D]
MAYEPLHHRYRPQRFDQLVGQVPIVRTLSNAVRLQRIAPAYLFTGPRGTGKTSSARILARSLNCTSSPAPTAEPCGRCEACIAVTAGNALDVIEIDAASNTGVDNIRELIERARFAPVQLRWKVYVVDECHMLSTAAFNALLKTLEEPPPRVVFILATTDPQRVLPTILSRCQRFDFCRIPLAELVQHLSWISQQEQIAIAPDALRLVAQFAQGGLRDAESLLDQLSLLSPPVEAAAVWELMGAVPEQEALALGTALANGDPLPLLEIVRQLFDRGYEPNAILQTLTTLLRDLLVAVLDSDSQALTTVSPASWEKATNLAQQFGREQLLNVLRALKGTELQLRHSSQPRLALEVLLAGLLAEAGLPLPRPAVAAGTPAPVQPTSAARDRSDPRRQQHGLPPPPAPARQPTAASQPPQASSRHSESVVTSSSRAKTPSAEDAGKAAELDRLWQTILSHLQLPSTQTMLQQQGKVVSRDESQVVVQVNPAWLGMAKARHTLLEQAVTATLGKTARLLLTAGQPPQADRGQRPVSPPAAPPKPRQSRTVQSPGPPPPTRTQPRPRPQPAPDPRQQTRNRQGAPPRPSPETPPATALDATAKNLANFFNGEVVDNNDDAPQARDP